MQSSVVSAVRGMVARLYAERNRVEGELYDDKRK